MRSFAVDAAHPALAGHFPGRPVVPGVLLLEEVLAAVAEAAGLVPPLRLGRVKFASPAAPGEAVTVAVGEPRGRGVPFACVGPGGRAILTGTAEPPPEGA